MSYIFGECGMISPERSEGRQPLVGTAQQFDCWGYTPTTRRMSPERSEGRHTTIKSASYTRDSGLITKQFSAILDRHWSHR